MKSSLICSPSIWNLPHEMLKIRMVGKLTNAMEHGAISWEAKLKFLDFGILQEFWCHLVFVRPYLYITSPGFLQVYFLYLFLCQFIRNLTFRFQKMKLKAPEILPHKVEQWVILAGISELISWNIRLIFFMTKLSEHER